MRVELSRFYCTFFLNVRILLMKMTVKFPRATEKYHMDIDTVFIVSGAWKNIRWILLVKQLLLHQNRRRNLQKVMVIWYIEYWVGNKRVFLTICLVVKMFLVGGLVDLPLPTWTKNVFFGTALFAPRLLYGSLSGGRRLD